MTTSGGSRGDSNESSQKGTTMAVSPNSDVDQLNQGFVDMSLNSNQDNSWDLFLGNKNGDGGGWRSWVQPDTKKTDESANNQISGDYIYVSEDELLSDDYDSDDSQESHDTRKKNPWFSEFFGILDDLTPQQINEPVRQWHCPACQNGPCSIKWYRGMKSFLTHIKTKGTRRPKLHRDLAKLLDEELCRRGAMVIQSGESYGKWKGLDKDVKDHEIVWPPMVIVMNTQLQQDENEKWIGIGTQELLSYFDSYEAVRARSSFGPEGHRGMSVLIFDTSAVGYLEAERLSKEFEHEGLGRDAWDHYPNVFHLEGNKRQLYGFMATKEDLEIFNQYSHAKLKMKFELVSYQEKVVKRLKQMNEDSQQLHWYKKKVAKQEISLKALEESFWIVSQKLKKLEEESRIVRERTQLYHEQNKEEMDFQEKFFKDQLKVIQDARNAYKKEESKRIEKSCVDERKEKVES
ncbi:protein SUPPRESSOR OF GENE SILENCING 3 [Lactuca sativa]|uniref:XS domain-containing protein n=1 Tax=Lactuca sativa TaxID=4236 RepID=A0A9R1V3Y7_LACSA|nr:protein SUPPRESSOR OF GENE SILENCING 3 [Lactuca sativa]KAJ0198087.1 hypothetical protein LSAT_V11C700359830 [Lactuca sativa]